MPEPAQLGDYKRAQQDIVRFLREDHGNRVELAALTKGLGRDPAGRIAAKVAHEAGERARRAPGLVEFNTLRRLLGHAKLPAVIDWVAQFLTGDEKLVLFAVHRDIQPALVDAFAGCAHIVAGDSTETIEAEKARFQEDPRCQLIVCSLQIAREAPTLTAASHVAFCELDWAPLAPSSGVRSSGPSTRSWPRGSTASAARTRATTDGDDYERVMGESILSAVIADMTG